MRPTNTIRDDEVGVGLPNDQLQGLLVLRRHLEHVAVRFQKVLQDLFERAARLLFRVLVHSSLNSLFSSEYDLLRHDQMLAALVGASS